MQEPQVLKSWPCVSEELKNAASGWEVLAFSASEEVIALGERGSVSCGAVG
jgi:hypothetical protein